MEKQPLIKPGWLRVLSFVIVLLVLIFLFSKLSGIIIDSLNIQQDGAAEPGTGPETLNISFVLIKFLVSFISSILAVFIFRRVIDKKTITSLGFIWKRQQEYAGTGLCLAVLILCLGTFILIANKNLQWTDMRFNTSQLLLGLGLMALAAFAEELAFRGYVLHNLMQSMNRWIALIISAVLFTFFHMGNPGISAIAVVNLLLAGILLGVNYIYTKNLWFGIFFHFAWNFLEGPILGYKVSGLNLDSIFMHELTGDTILTGGNFGFEGSVVNAVLMIVALMVLWKIYEGRFISHTEPRQNK